MNDKFIVLAPHLKYPPRSGGGIYVERIGYSLSLVREQVIILGTDTVTHYQNGEIISQQVFRNQLRTKPWAALLAIAKNSHYLAEKFITTMYRQKAKELVKQYPNAFIIYSFISSVNIGLPCTQPAIIITQNDEISWFQNQFRFSINPIQKLAARISENWIRKFLSEHGQDFFYVHITENDHKSYKKWMPDHLGFVVPAGVTIQRLPPVMPWDGRIRLLFVGSLGIKMNYDALAFFQKDFWPTLKDEFKQKIEVTVLGSQPSGGVHRLCQREHWQLLPDASEGEIHAQYGRATFAILPFPYTTGAKLKLLNALAAGLPVLATTNMKILPGQEFTPNLYADEPQEWSAHLQKFSATGILPVQRSACQQFAMQYSWRKIAEKMDRDLKTMGI